MQATVIQRILRVEPAVESTSFARKAFVIGIACIPGIITYELLMNHAPLWISLPFITYFVHIGVSATISILDKMKMRRYTT